MQLIGWRVSTDRSLDDACPQRRAGRWHYAGAAVVYCSSSPELAVLEARVHHGSGIHGYRLQQWICQQALSQELLGLEALPPMWVRQPSATRALGAACLGQGRTACLGVPSSVCPESRNLLINPALAPGLELVGLRAFRFDRRLLLKLG